MSANDRQFPEAEAYRPVLRLLWFYLKCLQRLPWNRPEVSLSDRRRMVAQLRSGVIRPQNPELSPLLLAEFIEKGLEQAEGVRRLVAELRDIEELHEEVVELEENLRRQRLAAGFHLLKNVPEASDPESAAAEIGRASCRERV